MDKNFFFESLKEKLPSNKYKERFLQELHDHLEDSEHQAMVAGNKEEQAQKNALKKMGDPQVIAIAYRILTEKRSLFLLYFEGLLWGLVSLPLYLYSGFLATSIRIHGLNEGRFFDLNEFISFLAVFLLLGFIVAGITFILYSFVFARFYAFISSPLRKYFLGYVGAIFAPPLVLLFVMAFSIQGTSVLEIIGGYLFIGAIIAYGVLRYNKKGVEHLALRLQKKKTRVRMWLHIVISSYIIIATSLLWLYWDSLFLHQGIVTILTPLLLVEILIHLLGQWTPYFPISPIIGYWAIGLLLSGTMALSLFKFLHYFKLRLKKESITFPWLYITLFTFSAKLLFFSPITDMGITWQKPTFEISKKLEQQQTWPFYNFITYITRESSYALDSYSILKKNDEFFIIQESSAKQFRLSDIKTVTDYHLTSTQKENISENLNFQIPAEIKCSPLKEGQKLKWQEPKYPQQPALYECPILTYKNQTIYQSQKFTLLRNILISKDGKWMLIALAQDQYYGNAQRVYLVQL